MLNRSGGEQSTPSGRHLEQSSFAATAYPKYPSNWIRQSSLYRLQESFKEMMSIVSSAGDVYSTWTRWSKEYLQSLQVRNKWTSQRRNVTEGDVVFLKDNNTCRNQFSLAKVLTTCPDDQGQVRPVTVLTSKGSLLDRPISKLVLLLESTEERPGIPTRSHVARIQCDLKN